MALDGDMTVQETLRRHSGALAFFIEHRMLCVGCPTEAFHTLADVARIHGYALDAFLEALEAAIKGEKTPPRDAERGNR